MAKWFQCAESSTGPGVVGRFADAEVVDIKASEAKGEEVLRKVPVLESTIPGSQDITPQRVKPFNQDELRARFPGAWEYYLEHRQDEAPAKDEVSVIKAETGTPLHECDFIPRAKIPFLRELGFMSVESLASMSDATAQNIKGGMLMRKKAIEWLART